MTKTNLARRKFISNLGVAAAVAAISVSRSIISSRSTVANSVKPSGGNPWGEFSKASAKKVVGRNRSKPSVPYMF